MGSQARLQKSLGHEFSDGTLLTLALTHRSAHSGNNERLEFLGDSIVNYVIGEALFQSFPKAQEGDLSRMRASLVNGSTLAEVARELALGEYLILGSGEKKSGGHRRESILADTLEAVIGAILLDSSMAHCRERILAWFATRLAGMSVDSVEKDAKTRLQEFLQGQHNPLPIYQLLEVNGEDHKQHFQVACTMSKPPLTVEGSGTSRRRAEQAAAESALRHLQPDGQ
ncbi:MAG: ribonuclease III [Halieaceae bacterium]|jgi:ribonuclease III|nr:ribonuclease III [Halieaceae bacterium]